jgi:hypothetical protein
MTTEQDVAQWMLEQIESDYFLYQEAAVGQIAEEFGEQFTYVNENGNLAIDKNVLKEFRRITGDAVIWERSERMWRKREQNDSPGRMQD